MIEIGLSLGILYSENRTLGIKDYTERVSKHDDVFFNFFFFLLILFLRIANNIRRSSEDECFLFTCKLLPHRFLSF